MEPSTSGNWKDGGLIGKTLSDDQGEIFDIHIIVGWLYQASHDAAANNAPGPADVNQLFIVIQMVIPYLPHFGNLMTVRCHLMARPN